MLSNSIDAFSSRDQIMMKMNDKKFDSKNMYRDAVHSNLYWSISMIATRFAFANLIHSLSIFLTFSISSKINRKSSKRSNDNIDFKKQSFFDRSNTVKTKLKIFKTDIVKLKKNFKIKNDKKKIKSNHFRKRQIFWFLANVVFRDRRYFHRFSTFVKELKFEIIDFVSRWLSMCIRFVRFSLTLFRLYVKNLSLLSFLFLISMNTNISQISCFFFIFCNSQNRLKFHDFSVFFSFFLNMFRTNILHDHRFFSISSNRIFDKIFINFLRFFREFRLHRTHILHVFIVFFSHFWINVHVNNRVNSSFLFFRSSNSFDTQISFV